MACTNELALVVRCLTAESDPVSVTTCRARLSYIPEPTSVLKSRSAPPCTGILSLHCLFSPGFVLESRHSCVHVVHVASEFVTQTKHSGTTSPNIPISRTLIPVLSWLLALRSRQPSSQHGQYPTMLTQSRKGEVSKLQYTRQPSQWCFLSLAESTFGRTRSQV